MRVWHGRGMSVYIKQALRLALCLTNPSALLGAGRLFFSLIEKRIPAGSAILKGSDKLRALFLA